MLLEIKNVLTADEFKRKKSSAMPLGLPDARARASKPLM